MEENKRGRPTEKTPAILAKIEEAAALGASIEEIAFWAGIHRATLYRWMDEDKDLSDRIEELREKPILLARQTVIKNLSVDANMAFKYLERKKKDEFAELKKVETSDKTIEDLFKEYDSQFNQLENEEARQSDNDREVAQGQVEEGTASTVPVESSPAVLLGTEDAPKSNPQG